MQYGILRDYTPVGDVWIMGLVLGCFLALILIVGHHLQYIKEKSHRFFFPTNRGEKTGQKSMGERSLPYLSSVILVLSSGVMFFAYMCSIYDFRHGNHSIFSILLLCIFSFASYYLLRWLLYRSINWVFFERNKCAQWMSGFGLLVVYESVLSFVLMTWAIFYHLDFHDLMLFVVLSYGMLRILVIPFTKRIFFPNFYGLLHLFAYLCTLEIVPLLALWKICIYFGATH